MLSSRKINLAPNDRQIQGGLDCDSPIHDGFVMIIASADDNLIFTFRKCVHLVVSTKRMEIFLFPLLHVLFLGPFFGFITSRKVEKKTRFSLALWTFPFVLPCPGRVCFAILFG